MNNPYLSELHKKYNNWIKSLDFYADELKTFTSRLEEVVMRNTKREVRAQIEHFQNQFIREKEVIDILKHDIAQDEKWLVANAKRNNVATDHRRVEENEKLVDRMETFELEA